MGSLRRARLPIIGTKNVHVAATLVDPTGAAVTPTLDTCSSSDLAPDKTCVVRGGINQYFCRVTTNSAKVRVGLGVFESDLRQSDFLPATK